MLNILAVSLALTLVLEGAFALACGLRGRRELGLTALVNCLTNPPAVLFYYTAVPLWGPVIAAALAECAAVLVEWRCYRAFSRRIRHPFWFSLTANAVSYGAGRLINLLF